jgi:hypothetical protein
VKAQNLRPTFSSKSADIGVGGMGWVGGRGVSPLPKEEEKFCYLPETSAAVHSESRDTRPIQ